MNIVDPQVDPKLVPEGSKAIIIARNDPDWLALPSIRTPRGQVITRWSLTLEERAAIANGEDIFVTLISFGAINPMSVTIGPVDWTKQPLPFDET